MGQHWIYYSVATTQGCRGSWKLAGCGSPITVQIVVVVAVVAVVVAVVAADHGVLHLHY